MNILVTGFKGFIGKNLVAELKNRSSNKILQFDKGIAPFLLDEYCKDADFVFHLAGVNRPKKQEEFMEVNYGLTATLLNTLKKHQNKCPVMVSSSIQAELDNPYGKSKKAEEELLFKYKEETDSKVLVYRFPNVFGKWSRPNYNSVVATFCYNIAHDLPITINDPSSSLKLAYIDDVVAELINALKGKENRVGKFCEVSDIYDVKLQYVANLIQSFKLNREELIIPEISDALTKKLYSTYISFLPEDKFCYNIKANTDARGSFTEFIKIPNRGQVSVNIIKPGIKKGDHWHHTKSEKFLVVNGKGVIRFRKVGSKKVIEYKVSADKMQVIDIPTGYTHNIENLGQNDMITIIWANESYNPDKPDTYHLEV